MQHSIYSNHLGRKKEAVALSYNAANRALIKHSGKSAGINYPEDSGRSRSDRDDKALFELAECVIEKFKDNDQIRKEIYEKIEMFRINITIARAYHDVAGEKSLRKEFRNYLYEKEKEK